MAGIDRIYTSHYYDKQDFVIWCIKHKPSFLDNIFYPFDSYDEFHKSKTFIAKQLGIKLVPKNEDKIDAIKIPIASFLMKYDKYLYWHCPLEFVREYLETQCGFKKANWFIKLFWKY